MAVPAVAWELVRDALALEASRVTALLRSVGNPAAAAVGDWTLAEVAMHLTQAWIVVPGMAADDLSDVHALLPELAGTAGDSLISDVWELAGTTAAAVRADSERDPDVLAARLEAAARHFIASLGPETMGASHAWLVEGVQATGPTLLCHLLNETLVHGYDIARADGRRWPIPRGHAAMVLEGFLIPVLQGLDPRALVDQVSAAGFRATYELRIRGGGRHLFCFDDGALAIEPVGPGRADCVVSVDPAAMLLVVWGRRSHWPAIARGQMMAWGPKPWLAPRFPTLMRNP